GVAPAHRSADGLARLVAAGLRFLHPGGYRAALLVQFEQGGRGRRGAAARKPRVESLGVFTNGAQVMHRTGPMPVGAQRCPVADQRPRTTILYFSPGTTCAFEASALSTRKRSAWPLL